MVQLVKDKKAIVVAVRGENTQNPADDRHGCYRTLQNVLAQINAVLLQYSPGTDVDTFFLSSQSLQEQTELEDAYKYGLQELLHAEQLPDESRASATNGSKPAKIGRVFRQSKSEEVTNILIQGFDLRCIKYYGMECRVEWLPEDMKRHLCLLDIEDDKICEDYRSVANMLGISSTRVGVINRNLPSGQSVTLALLNEWREQKCRPCVTIGMLHTLLLFMGLVDKERAEILKQLQKVLDEHGQTGPFGIHPTAEELYLSIEERSRKVTLKKNWKRLTDDIMASNLVDRLDDLIPNEKREKITSAESHSLAAQLLLESLLLCKGTGWFDEFMQALKDNNYNVLAQYLMLQCEEEREASSEYMSNYDHLNPGDMEVFGEPIRRTQSSSVRRIRFYHGQFKGFTHAAGKTTLTPLTQEELKVVRKLDQSNIVRFLGYMENDFSYTIVSELCDKSLRDRLKRSQETPPQSLLRKWMKEVTSAVRYLHGGVVGIRSDDVHPIVHGRINTTKCLLLGDVLKLSGAGVSRHKADHRDRRIIDAFMAPEVHDPAIGFTPACDIYALGVLFWEMFTQQIPELPEARSDTLGQTISGNDAFPPEVRNVMPLCWKRDGKERATIGDIIARLFQ